MTKEKIKEILLVIMISVFIGCLAYICIMLWCMNKDVEYIKTSLAEFDMECIEY